MSNRALKELVKFFKSVDTPQKLADFFNQGKDLKKQVKFLFLIIVSIGKMLYLQLFIPHR